MEKLSETKDEDADDGGVVDNKNSIGEESEKEGGLKEVVTREFLDGIDEIEDDASVFKDSDAKKAGSENPEEGKAEVNASPGDKPGAVDAVKVGEKCFHLMFILAYFSFKKGLYETWQGRQDLNPRHLVLETSALPAELRPYVNFIIA